MSIHLHNKRAGYIMILNVVLFIAITTAILVGVGNPVLSHYSAASGLLSSKQAYIATQSIAEDEIYRFKSGKQVTPSVTLPISSGSVTAVVTNTASGKNIVVTATSSSYVRNVQADLLLGTGVAFHYGIQSGEGGFVLNGGAVVNGNVYSNGDIVATNGVTITGSAIAANSAELNADQSNTSPTTPTNSINFRDTNSTQDLAQSFQVTGTSPVNKVSLYMKKIGSPTNATVRIVKDSSGSPGTTDVFTTDAVLSSSLVGTSGFGWVDVVFPDNEPLVPGTTYWLIIDNSSNSTGNYYVMAANSGGYGSGTAKIGKYSGTWNNTSPSGLDIYFQLYLGGLTSSIGGDTYPGGVVIGSGGVGDAWAHSVQGATVAGNLYCQSGQYNNKSCNTSKSDPSPQSYPVSDANIQDWKAAATAGGTINGNVTIGYAGGTLGPTVITGNLVVNGGGTLTITGTVWVQGTLTVSGGGKITLDPSYGASGGVIVTDGIVNLAGGGDLSGSGTAGSYLMILTTSNCPFGASCGGTNALTLSGGAGAVILNAQNGNMTLNGGSGVHEATAYKITASGGANITYDAGLVSTNFSSGPGGGYGLIDWVEF